VIIPQLYFYRKLTVLFLFRITHLYVCANSTLNFFIYYVNGKRFRKAWKVTFGLGAGAKRISKCLQVFKKKIDEEAKDDVSNFDEVIRV
jgi:hypothetical protein